MIGYIKGTVVCGQEREITVLTDGGVGYSANVTPAIIAKYPAGEAIELFIETLVREDAIILFGFERLEEKTLFNLLREVNKIGPKTSLSIISAATGEEIAAAIASGNSAFFKKISGVGAKTAEKIIIDLKDKIAKIPSSLIDSSSAEVLGDEMETHDAAKGLAALGYNPLQIKRALLKIENKDKKQAAEIVREALKIIRTH